MTDSDDIDDQTLQDLVRLVDGTLPPERLAEVEERVSLDPRLQAIVEEQLKGRAFAQGADPEAPGRVHATIAARAKRSTPRPTLALGIGSAAAVLAVLAAVFVVLVAPNTQFADVEGVAEVGVRVIDEAPAGVDPDTATVLEGEFAGLRFPNWEPEFQLTSSGARTDTVEGRTVKTTFYDDAAGERRLAYTIVSGDPLGIPEDAVPRTENGVQLYVFEGPDGSPAVTWERKGHTCVLTGDANEDVLRALASWSGMGAVEFSTPAP